MATTDTLGIFITAEANSAIKSLNKLGTSLNNLSLDGNRSNKSFKNLTKSTKQLSLASLKLSTIIKGIGLHRLSTVMANAIKATYDMIETTHLFEVSMGNLAIQTDNLIQDMHEFTTLDIGNLRNRIGTFNLLGKTMGFTDENARRLALSVNSLSLDMGALFNVPYEQIAQDLRSGLIGQTRTLYKYGIDVTEAAIANEALAQGIEKSVRHMTQGEKMILRQAVLLKQMSRLQGDFAETFNTPANQIRVIRENLVTLSRTLGYLFAPMTAIALKGVRALTLALTQLIKLIGGRFGIQFDPAVKNIDDWRETGEIVDDMMDDLNSGLDGANKKAKELRKQLMGFDELNILNTKAPESGGGGGAGDPFGDTPLDGLIQMYDAMLDKIVDEAKEWSKEITKWFDKALEKLEPTKKALIDLWERGLKPIGEFSWQALKSFYENFLKPIGDWALSEEGLPRLIEILADILEVIDWDRIKLALDGLWKATVPLAKTIGKGLLDFFEDVIKPIAKHFIEEYSIVHGIKLLTDALEGLDAIISDIRVGGNYSWLTELLVDLGKTFQSSLFGFFVGFAQGFTGEGEFDKDAKLSENLWILAKKLYSGFVSGMSYHWITIGDMLKKYVLDPIGASFDEWVEGLPKPFKYGIQLIKEGVADSMTNLLPSWLRQLDNFLKSMNELMFLNWVAQTAKIQYYLDLWKINFEGFQQKVYNIVKLIFAYISRTFETNILTIKNLWKGLLDVIQGKKVDFEGIVKTTKEEVERKWKPIINQIQDEQADITAKVTTKKEDLKKELDNTMSVINARKFLVKLGVQLPDPKSTADLWYKNIQAGLSKKRLEMDVKLNITNPTIRAPQVGGSGEQLLGKVTARAYGGGGFPDVGELFVAREAGAELVGNIGGRTAVVNNEQIVSSISRGVYEAVRGALSGSNNNPMHLVVNVLGDTVMDRVVTNTNRESIINNKTVINV